jgi:hypothetical protein
VERETGIEPATFSLGSYTENSIYFRKYILVDLLLTLSKTVQYYSMYCQKEPQ